MPETPKSNRTFMVLIDALARLPRTAVAVGVALVAVGCTNTPHRAPIEDRTPVPRAAVAAPPTAPASAPAAIAEMPRDAAADNAGRPGYYTVKPGDTLIRIAMDTGQSRKDLMRWNSLTNPNLIEVGQVLRIVAPGTDPGAAVARPVTTPRVETRPLDARPAASASAPLTASAPGAPPPPAVTAPVLPPPVAAAPTAPRDADDDVSWGWPAAAPVAAPFDDARNKGLVFRGKAGDPVLAAADGRVVYAGSGLRGYGNLVILKHNNTYLTAYAHNQTLLVKEDQAVRKGQKIAEMGSTDTDRVKLHFEIRRQGKPVDPTRYLPPR
ncbi:MAG TPA: peptidoglycan DD-metalloendopeptidase family protein [Ramlibacter sp.]|nr:peptidoglycan DD-metalloendopeptidase family protein [Ramlibacter sp.]